MIFQKYKKWIIIGLVIIGAFIIFVVINSFKEQKSEELLTSTTRQTPSEIVGAEIIGALNQIRSLKLERGIFENHVYKSLKDRSQKIPTEPVGKANPFSSIQNKNRSSGDGSSGKELENVDFSNGDGINTITNDSFVKPPVI